MVGQTEMQPTAEDPNGGIDKDLNGLLNPRWSLTDEASDSPMPQGLPELACLNPLRARNVHVNSL